MAAPLLPGDPRQLGSYWLAGRIGSGGQGDVYEGYDAAGDRYAVKALRGVGEAQRRALRAEIQAIRKVAPFCTVRVVDADLDGPVPFVVSEYVAGGDLQNAVDSGGPRPSQDLHRLAVGIATALTAIHQAGVIHRDLKPANVLLGPDGPRVIDFGIARTEEMSRTAVGGLKGTPAYIAPESFNAWLHPERFPEYRPGPAVDVWAWGAIVMFCATGRKPFGADTLEAAAYQVLHHEPDVSVLEEPLRSLVSAALSKDPDDRPKSHELLLGLIGVSDPAAGQDEAGKAPHPSEEGPSLGETAEAVFASLEPRTREAVPRVFLRLVAAGENAQDTLRSAGRAEFADGETDEQTLDEVLRSFTEAEILRRDDERVHLSNAVLLRVWPRLRDWVEAEHDGLGVHQELTNAARQWDGHGRKNSDLYQGTFLDRALSWAAAGRLRLTLNLVERDFLEAGSALSRRRVRNRTLLSAVLAVLLLVAVGTAVFAFDQRRTVIGQRDRVASAQVAGLAQSLRRTQPELARRLAVASSALGDTPESWSALLALRNQWENRAVKFPDFHVSKADLDGTGRFLLATDRTHVELWDVDAGRRIGSYKSPVVVDNLDLSDDGKTVALYTRDGYTTIMDAPGLLPRNGHRYLTNGTGMLLSPTGAYLAANGPTKVGFAARLWDTRTGRLVVDRAGDSLFQYSFSQDERLLSLVEGRKVTWIDLPSGKNRPARDFGLDPDRNPGPLVFSPSGDSVAVRAERGVHHFMVDDFYPSPDYPPIQKQKLYNSDQIYFSHDGRYLARNFTVWAVDQFTGELVMNYPTTYNECMDGTYRFSADDSELRCIGGDGAFRSLDVSRLTGEHKEVGDGYFSSGNVSDDGSTFALPGEHGIQIWSPSPPAKRFDIAPSEKGAFNNEDVLLSPDGRLLAVRSTGEEIEIWDLVKNSRLGTVPVSADTDFDKISFSPDNKALVHQDENKTAERTVRILKFWDLTTMKLIREVAETSLIGRVDEHQRTLFRPDGKAVISSPNFGLVAFPSGKIINKSNPDLRMDAISADGRTLYVHPSATEDSLFFIDAQTLRPKGEGLRVGLLNSWSHARPAHSPDDRLFATVHGNKETDQQIKLWDTRARIQLGIPLTGHRGRIILMAFSSDGSTLTSVDEERRFLTHTIARPKLTAELCAKSGPLGESEWATHIPDVPYRRTC